MFRHNPYRNSRPLSIADCRRERDSGTVLFWMPLRSLHKIIRLRIDLAMVLNRFRQ